MTKEELYDRLKVDKSLIDEISFNPYFIPVESALEREIVVSGENKISMGTNDYLGLSNNPDVKKAAFYAVEKYGVSMCGTPIVIGHSEIHQMLEKKTAQFLKQDESVVFPSCYQANMSIFQLLSNGEDVIIADKEIHSSLLNGIVLTKAEFNVFPHNDIDKLDKVLARNKDKRMRFVVVEGMYSTYGDTAKMKEICDLCKKHNAISIVDEAHAIGVIGDEGRGILELCDVYDEVDIITGSYGKAVGTFGGFLAGKSKVIDIFRYSSPMYFYSTALPPAICASTVKALEIIPQSNNTRKRINNLAASARESLKKMKLNVTESSTPLISVIFKNTKYTLTVSKILFENGIYAVPFVPPSVPKKSPRIRFTFNAHLCDENVDCLVDVFKKIKLKKPELFD